MVAAKVAIGLNHILLIVMRNIHLTTEDRLERFLTIRLELFVYSVTIVEKLLYTEHISMVGNGNTLHSVGNSLVNELTDRRLSVKYGIIRMNV